MSDFLNGIAPFKLECYFGFAFQGRGLSELITMDFTVLYKIKVSHKTVDYYFIHETYSLCPLPIAVSSTKSYEKPKAER